MTGIVIDVQSRSDKAQRDLTAINESLKNIEKSTTQVTRGFSQLVKGLGALAAGGGIATYVVKVSNEFTNLENKIALVTGRTKELVAVQTRLLDMSSQNRMQIAATGQIYSTLAKSMARGAASSEAILKATDSLQKAVALSGSSADSANAAIIQLGQGLASGTLRGEELNSVMEQTPRVAKAIADGLGVTIGEMRSLAAEGKVTSDSVFKALLSQTKEINREFALMTPTLEQSGTALNIAFKEFTNSLDVGLNLTGAIAAMMIKSASSVRTISIEAQAFGAVFAYSFGEAVRAAKAIVAPIVGTFKALASQLYDALPKGFFTRTLSGDVREGLRQIDDATKGAFSSIYRFFRFGLQDLITYDSEVESVLKRLKRLSPSYWLTGGFDTQTLNRFFSRETLYKYGIALAELSRAVARNSESIFVTFGNAWRAGNYELQDFNRYLGLTQDTLLSFKIGSIDALVYSTAELLRGITGVYMKWTDFGKLIREIFNPASTRLVIALEDVAESLPRGVLNFIRDAVRLVIDAIPIIVQMINDFMMQPFSGISVSSIYEGFKSSFKEAKDTLLYFIKEMLGMLSVFDIVERRLTKFGNNVIGIFFNIYDAVIGHSYWTDTIISILDTSDTLWEKSEKGLKKFGNKVIALFKDVYENSDLYAIQISEAFTKGFKSLKSMNMSSIKKNLSEVFDKGLDATQIKDKLLSTFSKSFGNAKIVFKQFFDNASYEFEKFATKIRLIFGIGGNNPLVASIVVWETLIGKIGTSIDYMLLSNIESVKHTIFFLDALSARLGLLGKFVLSPSLVGFTFFWKKEIASAAVFQQEFGEIMKELAHNPTKVLKAMVWSADTLLSDFGYSFISTYRDIHDQVAYNYWPKTVKAINKYTDSLFDSIPGLKKFSEDVNSSLSSLKTDSITEFTVDIKFKLKDFGSALKDLYTDLTVQFPYFAKALVASFAAIAFYMLAPMNKFTAFILTDLVATATAAVTLLADQIGSEVFGIGIAQNIGESVGKAIGMYITEFIRNIPSLLNVLLGTIYGFGKAFLSELLSGIPLLGGLLSGLFNILTNIADTLGIGGPLGLIGAVLFGKGLVALNTALKLNIGWIEKMGNVFGGLVKFFTASAGKAEKYGVIGKLLFNLGPSKIIGALGLILQFMGTFDNLFGGSVIGSALSFGILGSMLFGANPRNLVNFVYENILKPLKTKVNDVFTTTGPRNMGSMFIDFVAGNKKKVAILVAAILLFTSSMAKAEDSIVSANTAFDNFIDSVMTIPKAIFSGITDSPLTALLSVALLGVAYKFGKDIYKSVATALSGGFGKAAGGVESTGLFSKLVTKIAEVGVFLKDTLGSTAAFQKLSLAWDTLLIGLTMKWRVFANWFKTQWAVMMASEAMRPIKTLIEGIGMQLVGLQAKFKNLSMLQKNRLVGAAVVGGVAGATALSSGMEDAANAAVIAGLGWQVFGKAAMGILTPIVKAIGGVIAGLTTVGIVIGGLVAAATGGLLYAAIFGEGTTFFEKLEDTIRKLSIAVGLVEKLEPNKALNKVREGFFTQQNRDFAKKTGIAQIPDFSAVDFDLISPAQKKAIDEIAKKMANALTEAEEQYDIFKEIPDKLRENVSGLATQLEKVLAKAEVAAAKDIPNVIKNLDRISVDTSGGFLYAIERTLGQTRLDIEYGWEKFFNVAALSLREYFAPDDKASIKIIERQLQDLAGKKQTDYNYRYKALGTEDKALTGKLGMIEAPDMLSNVAMQKALTAAVTEYEAALKSWYTANNNYYLVGGKEARESAGQNLALARKELDVLADQILKYQQREGSVKRFQGLLTETAKDVEKSGIQIDTNILYGAGEEAFMAFKRAANASANYKKQLEDTSVSGIASFEEMSGTLKRKLEQDRIALLAAQQGYDEFSSSVQQGFANAASRIDLGISADVINRMTKSDAAVFRKRAHDIESLMTQLKNDKAMADIIFPPGTDNEVQQRIKNSDSPAMLMEYILQLKQDLIKASTQGMSVPDVFSQIASQSGVGFTAQDVAGLSASGIGKRQGVAQKKMELSQGLGQYESTLRSKQYVETPGASIEAQRKNDEEQYKKVLAWYANENRKLDKQLEYMAPKFDTGNAAIERIISNAGITARTFEKLPEQARGDLSKLANELVVLERQLETEAGAGAAAGWKKRAEEIKLKMQEIGSANRKLQQSLSDMIGELQNAGFSAVTVDNIFAVTPETLRALTEASDKVYNIQKALEKPGQSLDEMLKNAAALAKAKQDAAKLSFKAAVETANASPAAIRTVGLANTAGISIDQEQSNRLSSEIRKSLDIELGKAIELVSKTSDTDLDDASRAAAQRELDDLRTRLNNGIAAVTAKREDTVSYQMGQSFATSTTDALTNGIKDILSGREDSATVLENITKTFAESVVNAFVEGLMNPLTGQNGIIQKTMSQLGSTLFNIGGAATGLVTGGAKSLASPADTQIVADTTQQAVTDIADGVKDGLSDMPGWFSGLWESIKGGFSSFASSIGSVLSSISGGVSGGMDWISGLFSVASVAAATGGSISGPGTGTSDSIPAMLSNGEFVVNAKQATKFAPLLSAINSGGFKGFAEGGAVDGGTAAPVADMGVSSTAEAVPTSGDNVSAKLDIVLQKITGLEQAILGINNSILASTNQLFGMLGVSNLQLGILQFTQMTGFSSIMTELAALGELIAMTSIGMATGGFVSGAGTGTSDSIPAMLSNGEFVVNARQTAKFAPLLQAINGNRIGKFAAGGAVGINLASVDTITPMDNSKKDNTSQQVFNINITGDISRQTKQEIMMLMPQIASGVNAHNFEKSRKR